MNILFLTEFFQPEPIVKGLPFAEELVRRGHRVEVVTGFPNYPGGKVYPGYTIRPWQRETINGIDILRVALFPSHDRSVIRRALTYSSFLLAASTIGTGLARAADIAYVYHPPLTTGAAALVFKWLRGIPFIYDVQDLWPDTLSATGMVSTSMALRPLGAACRQIYSAASHITVISPGFRDAIVGRGIPAERVSTIYSWCDETAFRSGAPDANLARRYGFEGRFNVVFAGNVGPAQALSAVLEAARLVAATAPQVQFVFAGSGIEWDALRWQAERMGLANVNVRFIPQLPAAEAGDLLRLAEVLLVHLRDEPLFQVTIPSKTAAYLAVGRPVIMAVRGDAAGLVERSKAGVVCAPESPHELAKSVMELASRSPEQLKRLGDNGVRFYAQELSLTAGVDQFERLFMDTVRRRHLRR